MSYSILSETTIPIGVGGLSGQLRTDGQIQPVTRYTFKLLATDNAGAVGEVEVIVISGQDNRNVRPTLTGPGAISVDEGEVGVLARYVAADADSDALTWTMSGADAVHFSLESNGDLRLGVRPGLRNTGRQ